MKLAKAEIRTLELTVQAPATIFPREQAAIASRVTAPIRELYARKGDNVDAGKLLVQVDDRDAIAQRDDARAQVADAEANLQKMKSGTLPADIDRARGQVNVAEAALNQAQKNYERRAQLFKEGVIPNRDLLQSETELTQAKSNAEVASSALKLLQGQTGENDIRIAQARLDSARAKLDLAQTQLQFTAIRAPFSGAITDQTMYPGDMASPGASIFQIMDLSVITARAQVPEARAQSLRQGQACSFTASDGGPDLNGRITIVNRAVDPQRRTVEAWCEIENRDRKLQANVFGSVTVRTGTISGTPVVPVSAVTFNEGARTGTVLIVDKQMIAHLRQIEAGETVNGLVPILKGLNAGETVVIEGGYGLPDNTQVKVQTETANWGKTTLDR